MSTHDAEKVAVFSRPGAVRRMICRSSRPCPRSMVVYAIGMPSRPSVGRQGAAAPAGPGPPLAVAPENMGGNPAGWHAHGITAPPADG